MAERAPVETVEILDLENEPITYHIHRYDADRKQPILLIIDGSGCRGQLRRGFGDLYQPPADRSLIYARVTVEKPGVEPTSRELTDCSAEFRQRHSIDNWVRDILRTLQHLRATADWWDGRIYIYGWSDGGDVGARVMSYYPDVERAVLGAQGGGYTMAQHFEDFWDCAADRTTDREACLADVRAMFQDLRDNPVPRADKGDTNLLWRSRMFADLATLLEYGDTPLLVVHGALDRDHTPVESARLLVSRLQDAGRANLTYCEVPFMEHGHGSFDDKQASMFEKALLSWLFAQENAGALLEPFCDPSPDLAATAPPSA